MQKKPKRICANFQFANILTDTRILMKDFDERLSHKTSSKVK